MAKYLIIDSAFLIFRSHFAYPQLSNSKNQPVGAFFGFIKTILALINQLNPDKLIFTFDLPEPTWRHNLLSTYKSGRPDPDPSMIEQIPIIQEWCNQVTKDCFQKPGLEADDLIFSTILEVYLGNANIIRTDILNQDSQKIVSKSEFTSFELNLNKITAENKNFQDQFYIFSSDRDLYQIFSIPGVLFIKPQKGLEYFFFDLLAFQKKYQVKAIQWLDYKTLVGDNSDKLSGLEGVGPKTAVKILDQVGNLYSLGKALNLDSSIFTRSYFNLNEEQFQKLENFLNNPKNKSLLDNILANWQTLETTYRLSSLIYSPTALSESSFDLAKGQDILLDNNFTSLVKQIKQMSLPKLTQDNLF